MIGGLMVATYIAMRPKTSYLKYTGPDNATDGTGKNGAGLGSPGLKQSLLPAGTRSGAVDALPESFGRRSTFDVDYYRAATGQVVQSKGVRLVFRDLTYSVRLPFLSPSTNQSINQFFLIYFQLFCVRKTVLFRCLILPTRRR